MISRPEGFGHALMGRQNAASVWTGTNIGGERQQLHRQKNRTAFHLRGAVGNSTRVTANGDDPELERNLVANGLDFGLLETRCSSLA